MVEINKANGTCPVHEDGCTKFQLLELKMESIEKFIDAHEKDQKESRRYQRGTAVGVLISIGLILLKIVLG